MKRGCGCLYGIRALVSCDQHLKLRPGVNQSESGLIFQLFSFPIKRFRSADFEFKIRNLDIVFSFGLCMKCEVSIKPAIQSVRSALKQKNLRFLFLFTLFVMSGFLDQTLRSQVTHSRSLYLHHRPQVWGTSSEILARLETCPHQGKTGGLR